MVLKHSPTIVVAVVAIKFLIEVNITKESRLELTGGVEGLLIRDVLQGLGLEHRVVMPEDRNYGVLRPNGSWTGIMGMVQQGEADLGMGALVITEERLRGVNFSRPYFIEPLTFAIGKPQKHHLRYAYLYPFSVKVWVCCLGAIVAVSASIYFLLNRRHSFAAMLIEVLGNMLRQPLQVNANSMTKKSFLLLWLLCAFVLSSSYSGSLLAFLLSPTQGRTAENFLELSEAVSRGELQTYVLKSSSTVTYLKETQEEHLKVIGTAVENNQWYFRASDVGYLTSLLTEKVAYVGGSYGMKISLAMEEKQSKVLISKDYIAERLLGLALSRNFCCREKLDKMITRVLSAGLLEKYSNDACFRKWLSDVRKRKDIHVEESQIVLEEMSGTFQLLLLGYALSFMTFLLEIFFFKYHASKKIREERISLTHMKSTASGNVMT